MPWDSSQSQSQSTEPRPPGFFSSSLHFSTGDQTMFRETEGCLLDLLGRTWTSVVRQRTVGGSGLVAWGSLSEKPHVRKALRWGFYSLGTFVRT